LNYAQVLIEVADTHDTNHLIEPLQRALDAEIPGARVDMRQLETAAAFGIPVQIRISDEDIPTLRAFAARVSEIVRSIPAAARMRDNWGPPSFAVHLKTDPDRANISGVSNLDVAGASSIAMNGANLTVLRDATTRSRSSPGCGPKSAPRSPTSATSTSIRRAASRRFPFIEEMHAEGKPLEEALLDAGIVRLRPVLITVAATVIALFPLAAHGGPLWEPMCYAQIGGLTAAMFVTLIVVPVLYAIFVLDLKLVKWEERCVADPVAIGAAEIGAAAAV
jgi:multidrug efflux pump subunit AcrB